MDTLTIIIVLITQLTPSDRQVDTIYLSNAFEKPRISSQLTLLNQDGRTIHFDRRIRNSHVHYIDHQRKLRAIQPLSHPKPGLGLNDKHLYQFNGSDNFKIDSIKVRKLGDSESGWSFYTNTFYYTNETFSDGIPHQFSFETSILCFDNLSLHTLTSLSMVEDLQFVVDSNNQPVHNDLDYLLGLVVTAKYNGHTFNPTYTTNKGSFSTTYKYLQSVERINGFPPRKKVEIDNIDKSYELVPFSAFFE
jgi:hypothetical protein